MTQRYLYGIIEGAPQATLDIPGVDGQSRVHFVLNHDLAGVVSDYEGEELRALPKEALLRCLLAHQRVVERVMEGHTVLPVRFGTLLNTTSELFDLLSQGRSELLAALASVRGKLEMEVAATWDTQRVLGEIGRDEAVVQAREAIAVKGRPTVEEQIRLGQMVKAHLDQRRHRYQAQLADLLKPLVLDMVPNALLSDAMVMNVAFLIEPAQKSELEERFQQLDELFHGELTLRLIGPLPPYSFSSVEVIRLTSEQVAAARQTLGLGQTFTAAEVRRAYRHQAAQAQRHLIRGEASAQAQLPPLRQAVELLLRYCQSQPAAAQDRPRQDRWAIVIRRAPGDGAEPPRFGKGG